MPSRHLAGMTPRHNWTRETTEETMNQTRFRIRRLSAVLGLVVVASMLAAVPVAQLVEAQSATPAAEAGAEGITSESGVRSRAKR